MSVLTIIVCFVTKKVTDPSRAAQNGVSFEQTPPKRGKVAKVQTRKGDWGDGIVPIVGSTAIGEIPAPRILKPKSRGAGEEGGMGNPPDFLI